MKVEVYNQNNRKTKNTIELPNNIFAIEPRIDLIAQYVYVYRSNQRHGTQKTKSRHDVSGGGKKPWAQKTPDKARHGSIRSPIWVKGGHAHAIRPRDWSKRMPLKMKRLSLFSILSLKMNEDRVKVVDKIEIADENLTEQVSNISKKFEQNGKILIITANPEKQLLLGAKQLGNVNVKFVKELNTYNVVDSDIIIILENAVNVIQELFGNK